MISENTKAAWEKWIAVTRSRCHMHFVVEGGSIEAHVESGMQVGVTTATRVARDLSETPNVILEVGCSVGFKCIGLAKVYPEARVVGIEPDAEAVAICNNMAEDLELSQTEFLVGVGEDLPFEDQSFDLIVCHTVIEHVQDVDKTIAEMARVLKPGGKIHIEAPNYIWPEEPHLLIWVPPLCPKPLMRFLARVQGQGKYAHFAEHLQLVHPRWIERNFKAHGLIWTNRVERKLRDALYGRHDGILAYKRVAQMLTLLNKLGLSKIFVNAAMALSLYPSLLYTAEKPKNPRG